MGAEADCILFGNLGAERVAAMIEQSYGAQTTVRHDTGVEGLVHVNFIQRSDGKGRMFTVIDGNESTLKDVYDGERTVVRTGAWGEGPGILRRLTEMTGGFFRKDDSYDEFEAIKPEVAVEATLTPEQELLVAVADLLDSKSMGLLRPVLLDDSKRERLTEILTDFAERTATPPKP